MQSHSVPMIMLTQSLRRALAFVSEDAEPHAELESALPIFDALHGALERKDLTQAATLLAELCVRREATYAELVLRTAATRPTSD